MSLPIRMERRGYVIDALSVIVGTVRLGIEQNAETRTGAARELKSTDLAAQNLYKLVQTVTDPTATGGYVIQAAHLPVGKTVADVPAGGWATIATISASGLGTTEIGLSGIQVRNAVMAVTTLASGEALRVQAVRAVAGNGSNGAAAPVPSDGTDRIIHFHPDK